ncbi:hypothetical protein LEL_05741 [Akanthomyces lecanii RCEF 1005]|uniref:Rhodopsin domain-containing protein n=1 Tax=Akanthomyces lecanii RCEF 1005 TaxID=1081108 RepID=A0A168G5L7_CORDF|nr:hypothetical protein LEL_05741 [Akanthomyces lecanii RCEF 1005]
MAITLGIITTITTLARLIFKRFFSASETLTLDDILIIGALLMHISCTTINVEGLAAHGLGKDIWTLSPNELKTFVFFFYIIENHFFLEITLAKLSLLLFYLNIFPDKFIRRLIWGTALVILLLGIASTFVIIFQCAPVQYFWTQYDGHSTGHCLDINAFAWCNAALNIATDIWMLGIPLSQIRKLKLHWKKKLGAAFMFLTGLFVTVAAILRMQSLVHFADSSNPTWDQLIVAFWCTIEVNVGIICTCLPTFRLILLRLFPHVFSTGTKHSNSYVRSSDRRSGPSSITGKKGYQLSELESTTELNSSYTGSQPLYID